MYQTMSLSGITDYHHHRHHHHHNSTPPPLPQTQSSNNYNTMQNIERMSQESAVVIFSISTCCMCHAIKRLFCSMGVHPTVYELDQFGTNFKEIETALLHLSGVSAVPVVFIGGKLVGSMDRVMGCHINGSLVPLLKDAGALWL